MGDDQTATKQGPDRKRVTVAEASKILGITAEAVRTRIKRGKLESIKDPPAPGGTVYVLLQADQTRPDIDPTVKGQGQTTDQTELVETLREQVAYLQGVIATRDQELALRAEEIRRRDTALEREQQLAAMFADRLQALEAPASSSEARESDVSPGPTGELEEVQEELAAEQDRREMAETTLHEGMAEEQRRREKAERERDDLRRELYALKEPRQSSETGEEQQGRGQPRSEAPGAQRSTHRPGGGECSEDRSSMQNDQTTQDAKRLLVAMSSNHPEARTASPYGLERPFSPSWADAEQAGLDRVRRDAAMSWLIENNMLKREEETENLRDQGKEVPDYDYVYGSVFRITDDGRELLEVIWEEQRHE